MIDKKEGLGKNPLENGEKNDNPTLKKAADEVRDTKKKVNDKVNEINEGNPNPEHDNSKDDLDLFNSISDSIISVYEDPQTAKIFTSMANKLGCDITEEFVKLISTTVCYAIFGAIGNYGDWLNKALQKDFNTIDELISRIDSDLATNIMRTLRIEKTLTTKGILEPIMPTEQPDESMGVPEGQMEYPEESYESGKDELQAVHIGKYMYYPTSVGWNVKDASGKIVGHFPTDTEAYEWITSQEN